MCVEHPWDGACAGGTVLYASGLQRQQISQLPVRQRTQDLDSPEAAVVVGLVGDCGGDVRGNLENMFGRAHMLLGETVLGKPIYFSLKMLSHRLNLLYGYSGNMARLPEMERTISGNASGQDGMESVAGNGAPDPGNTCF